MSALPPHASLIFDDAELAIYQEWRKLYAPKTGQLFHIPLPTAPELAEYCAWRVSAQSDSTDFPDVPARSELNGPHAQKCHHPLHPQAPIPELAYCPLCMLGQHSALVNVLYEAWEKIGGPWKDFAFEDTVMRSKYYYVGRAYQTARVGHVNAMEVLKHEAAEQEHGAGDGSAESWRAFGAEAALVKFQEQESRERDSKAPESQAQTPATPRKSKEKRISYDAATPEDTRHTPQALWSRNMPGRDPASPHACPNPNGWEDTSHYNDWEYNLSQCRILLCFYPDEMSETLRYRDLNAGEDRGMDNPHVRRLIEVIKAKVEMQSEELQDTWSRYLPHQSDIWQVWSKDMEDTEEFTMCEQTRELWGSYVEDWAWEIGDVKSEDEDGRVYEEGEEGWETEFSEDEEDDEDYADSMSLDEEEEHVSESDMEFDEEVNEEVGEGENTDTVVVESADLEEDEMF